MEDEQIRRLIEWLQSRVTLDEGTDEIKVLFDEPTPESFAAQGFSGEAVGLTMQSGWWKEMVVDIVETPDFAEPDETPGQVLTYARDLVSEYIRKRLFT